MANLLQEIRIAARTLLRTPGFSAVVVVTLAIGIAANTAIFGVVNTVLLRGSGYPGADRLVVAWERRTGPDGGFMFASAPNFADWRARTTSFASLAAFRPRSFFLTTADGTARIDGASVSAALFHTLGVAPAIGRAFTEEEDRAGAPAVVLLSHALWRTRFGEDAGVVGRTIELADGPHTIVGVMPAEFDFPPPIDLEGRTFPRRNELWTPLALDPYAVPRGAHNLTVVARLGEGVSFAQADAELRAVAEALQREYPETNAAWTAQLVPFERVVVGEVRTALLVLLGAVSFVLLIACANIANVMLARASGRRREYAIRIALGAGRQRLIRQALVETQLLAWAGGGVGLLITVVATGTLLRFAPALPRIEQAGVDLTVAAYAFAISVLTGLLSGLAPVLRAFGRDVGGGLRMGTRTTGDGGRSLRGALVVAEVALSLVLLSGAGLLFSSFLSLSNVESGVAPDNVLTMRLSLPESRYADAASIAEAYRAIEARVGALPGVESAGLTLDVPLASDHQGTGLEIEGEPPPGPDENRAVHFSVATPGYFAAMGIPVVSGRTFEERDTRTAEPIVVINEALARRFFAGEDPLGQRIVFDVPHRIVGVIGNVRLETLTADPTPAMVFPHTQMAERSLSLVVRTRGEPAALASTVRSTLVEFDRTIPVYDVRPMQQILADAVAQQRFSALMLIVFSAVALTLAAVGIYGVTSYTVHQRTREIGVRIAVGARASDVLRMVLGQGLLLVGGGIAIGLAGTLALTRAIAGLLYDTSPTDPLTLMSVSLFLLGVAAAACTIPALRASRVDPIIALRNE